MKIFQQIQKEHMKTYNMRLKAKLIYMLLRK